MSYYSIGTGHDVALVDLDLIDPQPRALGVRPTRRTYAASGAVIEEGNYVELEWNLIGTVAQWLSLLSQFGLGASDALTSEVTIRVPDYSFGYTRYNGLAIRPEIGREVQRTGYFIRSVKIVVRDLEWLA